MSLIIDTIVDTLNTPPSYLLNQEKRIYWLYLVSAIPLAYWVYWHSQTEKSFLQYLFPKKIWWSPSAWVDYGSIFFNSLIKVSLIIPYLIYGLYLAYYTQEYLWQYFGIPPIKLSANQTLFWYTITLTVFGDFMAFLLHYLMHKLPFLWAFHKVHHSATSLNPITQYRIHPIELLLINIRALLVFGVVTGIFDYLSDHQVSVLQFLGANVFSFIFLFFGANLRHSHVRLKYWNWLEYILISPLQHQIHHSNAPRHYDKNMGSIFAIWDFLFGTLVRSHGVGKINFGLGGEEDARYTSFWQNLYMPFKDMWKSLLVLLRFKTPK